MYGVRGGGGGRGGVVVVEEDEGKGARAHTLFI
jgi:hypothetical protein